MPTALTVRRSTQDFLAGKVKAGERATTLFKASADLCSNGFSEENVKSQLMPISLNAGLDLYEAQRQIDCGIKAGMQGGNGRGMMSTAAQNLAAAYVKSISSLSRVYHATQWHVFHQQLGWIAIEKDRMEADVRRFLIRLFEQWTCQKPNVGDYMMKDVMGCLKAMLIVSLMDKNAMDTAVWLREIGGEIHAESAEGWIATQSHFIHVPTVAMALHRGTPIPENAILPADRSLFTLGAVPCEFDINASCPRWEQFVRESCPGEGDMLQMMFGLALTYDRRWNVFFTLAGEAGTGKSTALNALSGLCLGTTCGVSLGKFSDRFSTHALTKNRLNLVQDMESIFEGGGSVSKREGILKSCTAGEKEQVELKGEQLEYRHLCALCVFGCNTLPRFTDRSQAISDRMRIISFPNRFRDTGAQDETLGQQLHGELSGILTWALKGYGALLDSGSAVFPETEHSKELKASNIKASRPEELFCDEELEKVGPRFILPTLEVYASYKDYCLERGYHPVGESKVLPLIATYMGVEKDDGNTRTSTSYGRKKCFHGLKFGGQPPRTAQGEERFTQ